MNTKLKTTVALIVLLSVLDLISGHGMLMDPVNRGSRWRVDGSTPRNYNDNEQFCGGFDVQWGKNGGKCGFCGDPFDQAVPRNSELGGYYGKGVIMKTYKQGQRTAVIAKITANHRGYFYFKICNLDNEKESEACFDRWTVLTSNQSAIYYLPSTNAQDFNVELDLPKSLYCNHCVLQWVYVAGNNWGFCPNGSGSLGCGPQEHFMTCSDITITKA